jgi:uncharacterized protein with GYD domain
MSKFVITFKFTEKGITNVHQSPDRAEALQATVQKMGGKVITALWTAGPFDGFIAFEAPDDITASAIVLGTARLGNVTTCLMPAYDAAAFKNILGKMK